MNWKKFFFAFIAAFVFLFVFGFVWYATLMHGAHREVATLLRPETDLKSYFGWLALGQFVMHRLIGDQLFQHRRRGLPVDPPQLEKAAVEPRGEEMLEIGVEQLQLRFAPQACAATKEKESGTY